MHNPVGYHSLEGLFNARSHSFGRRAAVAVGLVLYHTYNI
jgi:hypothetical protein